jgi:hypothetical protein
VVNEGAASGDDLGVEDFEADLTPGVGLLGALKGLRYNEWFALAEYVDNSLSSYLRDYELIASAYPRKQPPLHVTIKQSPDRLVIRDNAGGIAKEDIQRALSTGTPPLDRSRFNLYGIGMKAASIWFADRFVIKTARPGEDVGRLIDVDMRSVLSEEHASVEIHRFSKDKADHYTVIGLSDLRKPLISGRTLGKVRDFLASIYREYLADGLLVLEVMDEVVSYFKPPALSAKRFVRAGVPEAQGRELTWEKPINVTFELDTGESASAEGWAMVRHVGSTTNAGFALTQNRRVIEGAVEPWRPPAISGASNKHRYQRLQGQLEIQGVEPEITKTNFRWSDAEQERFITALHAQLDEEPLPLLRQADNYRLLSNTPPEHDDPDVKDAAETAVISTAEAIVRAERDVLELLDDPPSGGPEGDGQLDLTSERITDTRVVSFGGQTYRVKVELVDAVASGADWLVVAQEPADGSETVLRIQLSRASLFMKVFEGASGESVKPIVRVGAALAIAETAARTGGVTQAAVIRQYMNQLLRGELGSD